MTKPEEPVPRTSAPTGLSGGVAVPSPDHERIRQDQVALLYDQAAFGYIATVLNALLLAYAVREHVAPAGMALWVGLMVTVTLCRAFLVWRYRQASPAERADPRWERYYVAGAAAGGAGWGAASVLLFPAGSMPHQAFLLFIFAGMVAGAAIVLNAVRRAFLWFAGLMLIPMVIRIAYMGQELSPYITIGVGIFLVFVVVTNSNLHAVTLSSLKLRHQNRHLVDRLSAEKSEQERLNVELKVEVVERQAAQDALRRANEGLEQRVRERTVELTTAVQSLQQEVRERIQAQEGLRLSEERYRTFYDDNPSMHVTVSPDGFIVAMNQFGVRHLGFAQDELLGRPFGSLVPASHQEDVRGHIRRCFEEFGTVLVWESPLLKYDGSMVATRATARAVRQPDKREIVLIVCEDITDRTRLEEQLRQSQKMEAIGKLAGGIAHDFNNLLTVIRGYTDMLLRRLPPEASTRTEVMAVSQAGERARSLTQQLLAFSRQQVVSPRVLDLKALVDGLREMLQRLIGEHIVFTVQLSNPPTWIKADPGQIEQVIMNLVVNAVDAMRTGGSLSIVVGAPESLENGAALDKADAETQWVELRVRDTGCGMDAATQARIFEPFFTTKAVGEGTGLGLSTVYGIVKQCGGKIAVQSAPGQGTEFVIEFPAVRQEAPPQPAPPASETLPMGSETVVVVEDDAMVRLLASQILSNCGYTVYEAENGREALAVAEKHAEEIDLVVTDVIMPVMNGGELVEQLRMRFPRVKTLFVSGYTDDRVVRHGIEELGDNFLQKPFTPASLAHKVREVLGASGDSEATA